MLLKKYTTFSGPLKEEKFPGLEQADVMEKLHVTIRGTSMLPSLKDGQDIICTVYCGQEISVGQVVIFTHPFDNNITAAKRVKIVDEDRLFVEGDNPDPLSSDDSHNFGYIEISSVIAVAD